MASHLEMAVVEGPIVFERLVCFRLEAASPLAVKRELDSLVSRLGRVHSSHTNRVITKVIGHDTLRRIVEMQVMVPLKDTADVDSLVESGSRYFLLPTYEIGRSYHISIPNDQDLFRRAVEKFLECSTGSGLDEFDASRQHIIEVSRIDLYGSVLGFDLYLEIAEDGGD